jgi:hypothetical protein
MTVAILVVFALVVSTKQFVGEPIYCWVPAHFEGSHEDYTNSYCWIRNTYYLTPDDDVPAESESDKQSVVPYYQWVPMILLFQALLFYAPYFLWTALSSRSGLDLSSIVEAGQSFTVTDMTEIRDKTVQYMTKMMDRYLQCHNLPSADHTSNCCRSCLSKTCCGRRRGNYLIILYLIVKLLYLANSVGQLFLMNVFLGMSFHSLGFDVIQGAVDIKKDWPAISAARFPRVTMCDLKVRRLGNIHRYSVQCVLPINLFNEKIFLFIYFWLIVLSIVTLWSLIVWIYRFANGHERRQYVKRHLKFANMLEDSDRQKRIHRFTHDYLGEDGVFVMRLIAHNTNTLTVTNFMSSLWENFKKKSWVDSEVN